MNDLNSIYKELGEHICLYPFFGAFYQTNNVIPSDQDSMPNSVRPCSIVMSDQRDKWDITDNSITNGRNTVHWKKMRQDFLEGKFHQIYDCRSCSYNECSGTTSPRQQNNNFLAQFLNGLILFILNFTNPFSLMQNLIVDFMNLIFFEFPIEKS